MLVIAACAYFICFPLFGGENFSWGWGIITGGIGVSCFAAILGKLAGLARSQIQLTRIVQRLKVEDTYLKKN